MEKTTNRHIELPEPKNEREAEAFEYARILVSHIVQNPVHFRNGVKMGRTIGKSSSAFNPVKAVTGNESWRRLSIAKHPQYDSGAFNIGLIAGVASESSKK
jgi:hypothetical protein